MQLDMLEKTGMVLCATGRELMTPEGKLTGRMIPVPEKITYRQLLKHNCINCSSVVLRREVALEFPMHNEESHEDYIMWLEILRKYDCACAVNEPLLKYRLTNTGKSGSKLHSAKMTFGVYRCMGFGMGKSLLLFAGYAFHGVKKYALSYLGRRK
jgi:teichuronic acid biosynthesis glycosyltransferase TuaG